MNEKDEKIKIKSEYKMREKGRKENAYYALDGIHIIHVYREAYSQNLRDRRIPFISSQRVKWHLVYKGKYVSK